LEAVDLGAMKPAQMGGTKGRHLSGPGPQFKRELKLRTQQCEIEISVGVNKLAGVGIDVSRSGG